MCGLSEIANLRSAKGQHEKITMKKEARHTAAISNVPSVSRMARTGKDRPDATEPTSAIAM